jgi:hypothetical protein
MSTLAPWYQQVIDTPAQANNINTAHENMKLKEHVEKLQQENASLKAEVARLESLLSEKQGNQNE